MACGNGANVNYTMKYEAVCNTCKYLNQLPCTSDIMRKNPDIKPLYLPSFIEIYIQLSFFILSVVLDCSGHNKGYGFVRFTDETEQQKALIEMHHFFGIGKKCIRVSLATPKR